MKALDRWLQRWRIGKVRPFIPVGARVLDVGSADGALFQALAGRLGAGLGLDPEAEPSEGPGFRLMRGSFPADVPVGQTFDVITMTAVLEHVPPDRQPEWAQACHQLLEPGGVVAVTTPSPVVDPLLDLLIKLRVIDGMEVDQHYGFRPDATVPLFTDAGFELATRRRFQLGLNHLFVFRRAA
jgi:2-polyprenyl-3-methyl-5-hydroxy-6-metoxy-1,4-benzoquinol methylase